MKKKHVVIPVFIPHKGCPHDCIFCNQKKISGETNEATADYIKNIIEEHLKTIPEGTKTEVGFYGGSFTGIEEDKQLEYLEAAREYVLAGRVGGIRLSTRPDYITPHILGYLKEYGVGTIELGVQSLDDEVLKKSLRGHSAAQALSAAALVKTYGLRLGIQTMVGLPGDSREKSLETANKVCRLMPEVIRIYPALVIKETYLEELYKKGEYVPLSLKEAVFLCADLIEIYGEKGLNVIRVGLQPTDNVNLGKDVVAGPFHPAFRQLAESRLMLKWMEQKLELSDIKPGSRVMIKVNPKRVSDASGHKRQNILSLEEKYGIKACISENGHLGFNDLEVISL